MKIILKALILSMLLISLVRAGEQESSRATFFKNLFEDSSPRDVYVFKQDNAYKSNFGYLKKKYTVKNLEEVLKQLDSEDGFKSLNIKPSIEKLLKIMIESEVESIDHFFLKRESKKHFKKLQREKEVGAFYTLCFQEDVGSFGRNTCEIVEYSIETQESILELFSFEESEDGKSMELKELNAIRIASKVLEDHSFLKDDVGGWIGNSRKTMRDGVALTRCGNETYTYMYFLRDLYDSGFIKNLNVYKVTDVIRGGWFGLDHQALSLSGIHSKDQYVIDSWLDSGGEMARVLKLSDWKKKKDKRNIVPGIKGWDPLD